MSLVLSFFLLLFAGWLLFNRRGKYSLPWLSGWSATHYSRVAAKNKSVAAMSGWRWLLIMWVHWLWATVMLLTNFCQRGLTLFLKRKPDSIYRQTHTRIRQRLSWTVATGLVIFSVLLNVTSFGFWPIISGRAAEQITHDSFADWATGTADHDIDYRSGSVQLRSSTTVTHDTLLDFNDGEAFTSEIEEIPGVVQPKEAVRLLWDDSGIMIEDEGNDTETKTAPDDSGGAFFVWEDSGDVLAQHVNAEGEAWVDRVSLSSAFSNQQDPLVVPVATVGMNLALAVWSDDRLGDNDLFGQVFDADGNLFFPGDLLISTDCVQVSEVALTASSGRESALAVYEDYRSGFGDKDIYGSYITVDGSVDLAIVTAGGDQSLPQVITDANGDYFIAWIDERDGNLDIYAQKIDRNGVPLWNVNGNLVASVQSGPDLDETNRYLRLAEDGVGGVYVAWQRKVGELAAGGPFEGDKVDIYVQKLDATGAPVLAGAWPGVDGVVVNHLNGYRPQILADGAGGVFVAWFDARFIFPVIYAQRLSVEGEPVWPGNSFLGANMSLGGEPKLQLVGDDDGGFFAFWPSLRSEDFDLGGSVELNVYTQRVNAAGLVHYPATGENIVDLPTAESVGFDAAAVGSGEVIVGWMDERSGSASLYAQKLDTMVNYQTESIFTSPVLALSSPEDWEKIEFSGENLTGVTVETRTSDNLSIGAVATASSYLFSQADPADVDYYGFDLLPDLAIDGFESFYSPADISAWLSSWQSGVCGPPVENQWLEIDFGEPKTVSYVIAKSANIVFPTAPTDYRVQTWDGSDWVDQAVVVGNANTVLAQEFAPVTTEKVRLYADTLGGLQLVGFSEMEVYAEVDDVWSAWEPLSPAGEIMSPEKRLLQYRLIMNIPAETDPADLPQVTTVVAGNEITYAPGDEPPEYLSAILDAGSQSYGTRWESLSMDTTLPAGTNVSVETRSGNVPTPDATWSSWQAVDGEDIVSPEGRFFQYKLSLSTTDISRTPSVDSLVISYSPAPGEGVAVSTCGLGIALPGSSACFTQTDQTDFLTGDYSQVSLSASPDSVLLKHALTESWPAGGVRVEELRDIAGLLPDGEGGVILVWEDSGDIFAQKIDADGTFLADPIEVCVNPANQSNPQIIAYDDGGAIISWEDERNGDRDIFVNVMDGDGSLFMADGMEVASKPYALFDHRLARDDDGETYLYWSANNGVNNLAMVQKYAVAGEALWGEGTVVIATLDNYSENNFIVENEEVFAAWIQDVGGNPEIRARKVTADGLLADGWEDPAGVIVSDVIGHKQSLAILPDGAGGLYVTWEDSRDEATVGKEVYLSHLEADGEVAPGWPAGGLTVVNSVADQFSPRLVTDGEGGVMVSWLDTRDEGYFGEIATDFQHILVQRFSAEGNVMWDPRGVYATFDHAMPEEHSLLSSPDGGAVILFDDEMMGNRDLFAQKLTADGDYDSYFAQSWVNDSEDQEALMAVAAGEDYYSVWRDERDSAEGLYAQKIDFASYADSGEYTSDWLDAGSDYAWDSLVAMTEGTVAFSTRTKNLPEENLALRPGVTVTADSENTTIEATATVTALANGIYELSGANRFDLYQLPWEADFDDAFPHWVELSWPEAVSIASVVINSFTHPILNGQISFYPVDYRVQTWDGVAWVDEAVISGNDAAVRVHNFSAPVETTGLRLWIEAGSVFSVLEAVGINELEVYGEQVEPATDFAAVVEETVASVPGRFLQYRANLSSAGPMSGADIDAVEICGGNFDLEEVYEFTAVDSGHDDTVWSSLAAEATIPDGTEIVWEARAGNSAVPDGTWSDWATVSYSLSAFSGRYLAYRATLTSTSSALTPVIDCVSVSYLDSEGEEVSGGGGGLIINPIRKPFVVDPFTGLKLEGDFSAELLPPADFSVNPPRVFDREINLRLDGGPDAKYVAVAEDPNFFLVGLRLYEEELAYTLSPSYGPKTVYVRFYTDQGVKSDTLSVPVVYSLPELVAEPEPEDLASAVEEILNEQEIETVKVPVLPLPETENLEVAEPEVPQAAIKSKQSAPEVISSPVVPEVAEPLIADLPMASVAESVVASASLPVFMESEKVLGRSSDAELMTEPRLEEKLRESGRSWWWLLWLLLPVGIGGLIRWQKQKREETK